MATFAEVDGRRRSIVGRRYAETLEDWQRTEVDWAIGMTLRCLAKSKRRRKPSLAQFDIDSASYYLDRAELALRGERYVGPSQVGAG